MATKILTAAIALMMGISFSTFAGDNNKGNKEAKASNETKVEAPADAKATSFTYYVIAENSTQYQLSTTEPAPGACNDGARPCRVTSTTELPTMVNKGVIDSNPNVEIVDKRTSLPAI